MKLLLIVPLAAVLVLAQSCSSDSFKRATYHSLQNMAQQQCLKNPSADCPEREGYEEYQRKRKEAQRANY